MLVKGPLLLNFGLLRYFHLYKEFQDECCCCLEIDSFFSPTFNFSADSQREFQLNERGSCDFFPMGFLLCFLEETFTLFCDLFGGNGLLLEKYLGRNKKKLQEIRVSPRVFSEECGLYISQEPTITGNTVSSF